MSATSVERHADAGAEIGDEPRFTVYGVPWKAYVAIRNAFDRPSLRLSYLAGALEFMSPSDLHESLKTRIARLVEIFALERDVPLYGYGSTTFRKRAKEAGLEPDECYVMGRELEKVPTSRSRSLSQAAGSRSSRSTPAWASARSGSGPGLASRCMPSAVPATNGSRRAA